MKLEGELTIMQASAMKPRMLAWLQSDADLRLDLSGVREIDTAGVQLLLMLKQEAARHGQALHLLGHSAAVIDAFDLLGLGRHFGDPIVMDGTPREATHGI